MSYIIACSSSIYVWQHGRRRSTTSFSIRSWGADFTCRNERWSYIKLNIIRSKSQRCHAISTLYFNNSLIRGEAQNMKSSCHIIVEDTFCICNSEGTEDRIEKNTNLEINLIKMQMQNWAYWGGNLSQREGLDADNLFVTTTLARFITFIFFQITNTGRKGVHLHEIV